MRVGANKRIEVSKRPLIGFTCHGNRSEALDVQLVANTGSWRNNAHVFKRFLRPFQEFVALVIAFKLKLHILLQRPSATCFIGDNRMVDYQIARHLRVDAFRVAAQLHARFAHHRKVNEYGNARKILEQNAGRAEFDFAARFTCKTRFNQTARQLKCALIGISVAQDILEKHR